MDGIVVVDKPGGMTSHDVVARVRRILGTRRVGHGGTLDPSATGVLVIGVGRATRLLTYVIGADKAYAATIRLGQATVTDDAEGEVISAAPVDGVTDEAVRAALAAQTGTIAQVPSAVSAIKIDGKRAYRRVREGETVDLPAREVTISCLDVHDIRRVDNAVTSTASAACAAGVIDVDIDVVCSSGTYIRAIARDTGAALGLGGHLTALRRTAVGAFAQDVAVSLDSLATQVESGGSPLALTLDEAAARFFARRTATSEEAAVLSHGGFLGAWGHAESPYAVFAPDGHVIAIVRDHGNRAKPEVVLAPA